jgi:uncharacterized membrane protein YbaN (DUF454 family)
MVGTPKQTLRQLSKASPGSRFRNLYRTRQQSRRGGLKNALFIGAGLLTIAAGVVTYPVPVIPSELVILIGLALLAQGSMRGARILDWIELRLRRRFAWALEFWKPLPRSAKAAIGVLWMAALTGASYALYRLVAT